MSPVEIGYMNLRLKRVTNCFTVIQFWRRNLRHLESGSTSSLDAFKSSCDESEVHGSDLFEFRRIGSLFLFLKLETC